MKMDDEKETTMTKKTNKITAPKTAAPMPWPYVSDAPTKGRVIVTPEMARAQVALPGVTP